jgi:hypothetical protein
MTDQQKKEIWEYTRQYPSAPMKSVADYFTMKFRSEVTSLEVARIVLRNIKNPK